MQFKPSYLLIVIAGLLQVSCAADAGLRDKLSPIDLDVSERFAKADQIVEDKKDNALAENPQTWGQWFGSFIWSDAAAEEATKTAVEDEKNGKFGFSSKKNSKKVVVISSIVVSVIGVIVLAAIAAFVWCYFKRGSE
uniref:Transmembrane protein n=1 Tax=Paramoeba aestuarina TaxID=180227 RepID=A0A7S4KF70_9EUKA|mmetsp:Transcript_18168/g.28460  ORF Transcript_18168/g.28460 Transcript_18168/m.28460 type:complete len:137 (+) Transcript_18168:29-439(+)|eukprot:CAMPEP_0201520564 /NCGR_PEP_ID=MMETSP0161_2-20130828/11865_1 /ASSEMBLY_ACC=CAM_ASM_000251 /TAXON_ID=180227 /ORGANISM="Neoparamoeba aestuarina, Strain SoJaBio B1-5/56/2" /LENGTH=136 /DNA_ID=CAMNT_0047918975 /DNA_START=31 /DNA_END=441 /DNA_ORIENTATION=+